MKQVTLLWVLAVSLPALGDDYTPDVENGAFMHGDHCAACHLMDDHEALYTRANRIVTDRIRLNGQVSACVANLGLDWFPEEEKDVAEYLNQTYYGF
jgi:hypothetical protein